MNPYPSYKVSGVEWIGEIPSGWEKIRSKYLFKLFSGYSFKSEFFDKTEKECPVLITPGNFNPDGGLYFNEKNTIHYNGEVDDKFRLNLNDFLIVMTDLSYKNLILGKCCFLNKENCLLNQRIGRFEYSNTNKILSIIIY